MIQESILNLNTPIMKSNAAPFSPDLDMNLVSALKRKEMSLGLKLIGVEIHLMITYIQLTVEITHYQLAFPFHLEITNTSM